MAFAEIMAECRNGRGDVVLISGEAGVGKSRFMAEAVGRAVAGRCHVVNGWCVENGAQIMPLAPIIDVLRGAASSLPDTERSAVLGRLGADVSKFIPDAGESAADNQQATPFPMSKLVDSVLECLRTLSDSCPVVVVIEDVHWADESTRWLLSFVAPRLINHPVVLALTFRSDELHGGHPLRPFLVALERAVRPEKLVLEPFSAAELAELVAGITGLPCERPFVQELYDRSDGNAFFVEELLATGDSKAIPMLLRDAILVRTAGFAAPLSKILAYAAVAGPRIDPIVLAKACGVSEAVQADSAEHITAAGVWVRDEIGLKFRHELVRETIEAEQLPGSRAAMHAALAEALTAVAPDRFGEIARHWLLAGDKPKALEASVSAGQSAAWVTADAEALLHFGRALELWDQVAEPAARAGTSKGALLLDAADAAGRSRRFELAVQLGQEALTQLRGVSPVQTGLANLRLIEWAWFCSEGTEADTFIEAAIEALHRGPPSQERALAIAWHALLLLWRSQWDPAGTARARARAMEAIDQARACGSWRAEAHALLTVGICSCIENQPDGLATIRQALALALSVNSPLEVGRAYDSLAIHLADLGEHLAVIEMEREAIEYCRATGIYRVHGLMISARAIRSLRRIGRWQAVETRVEALASEFGSLRLEHFTLADSWGLILVRQGRLNGVAELLTDTVDLLSDHVSAIGPTTLTAVELAAAEGRFDDISDLVDGALEVILPRFVRDAAELVASAIGALADGNLSPTDDQSRPGSFGGAEAWLSKVQAAQTNSTEQAGRSSAPHLAMARAELVRLHGGPSSEQWQSVIVEWRKLTAPYETSYALWRLAEALLTGVTRQAAETRSKARAAMQEARRTALELGAVPLVSNIDVLARQAHVALNQREVGAPVEPRPETGQCHGLTARELEVLRLVAEGQSNGQIGGALFISPKTVSVHVSNILRKLGVASRIEAATYYVKDVRFRQEASSPVA